MVLDVKIEFGNYLLVNSGIAIFYDMTSDLKLNITLGEQGEDFNFTVIFKFTQDNGEREFRRSVEGDTITFTCVNFDNTLGTGTTAPIELATYKGKKVAMHLWAYALGEHKKPQGRKIEYNIYLEK